MILLQRLNSENVFVNPDLIKFVERCPDVTMTLVTGERLLVKNSPEEIIQKIIQFRKSYQPELKEAQQ